MLDNMPLEEARESVKLIRDQNAGDIDRALGQSKSRQTFASLPNAESI